MLLADLQMALADAKLESVDLKIKLATAQEQLLALQQQIQSKDQDRPSITDIEAYAFWEKQAITALAAGIYTSER